MKKLKVWLLTLVSVMAIVLCLAGCGSKAGTYKFSTITVAGHEYKAGEEIEMIPGVEASKVSFAEDYITIELKDDGTFTQTIKVVGQDVNAISGTWEENAEDSKKVDLIVSGSTTTVACDGSTITVTVAGNSVVLKK